MSHRFRSWTAFISVSAFIAMTACSKTNPIDPSDADSISPTTRYEMIDLGLLGSSGIGYGMIDAQGRVTAYGTGSDGLHVYRWQNGISSDLGALPGGGSIAFSPRGLVAGTACSHENDTCTFFLFNEGTVSTLETGGVAYGSESGVHAVTDDGTVIGAVQYRDRVAGVLWQNGARTELPALDGVHVKVYPGAMNTREQLIGQAFDENRNQARPYLWQQGVARDLGGLFDKPCSEASPSCGSAQISAINDQGDVVGQSWSDVDSGRAVVWSRGGAPQDLGIFPGRFTMAQGLNQRGDIFGFGGPDHWWVVLDGTLWTPGNPAGVSSHPNRMSELGDVIGWLRVNDGPAHSFVWHRGQITDLGPGPAGSQFGEAISINEHGEILGVYLNKDSRQGLVLWRPVRQATS